MSKNLLIGINYNRANECLKILESHIVRAKIQNPEGGHYDCQLRYFIFHARYLPPMCITSLQRTQRSDTLSPLTSTSIAIISHSSGVSIYRYQSNNTILQFIRASHRFFNTYRMKNRLSSSSLLIYVFPVTSSLRIFSSNCLRDDRANWPIDWLLNESLNRIRIVYINIHCSLLNFNNISETYSFPDFMNPTSRNKI